MRGCAKLAPWHGWACAAVIAVLAPVAANAAITVTIESKSFTQNTGRQSLNITITGSGELATAVDFRIFTSSAGAGGVNPGPNYNAGVDIGQGGTQTAPRIADLGAAGTNPYSGV